MSCQFRFVIEPDPTAVALRLFLDEDYPQGEVTGPLIGDSPKSVCRHVDRCVSDKDTAFMAAIRIANTNDTEVVVLGDQGLWDPRWGVLTCKIFSGQR